MIETWLYYEPSRDAGFQNLSHEVTHAERYIKSRNRRIYDKNIACNVHMDAWCTIKTFVNTKKKKKVEKKKDGNERHRYRRSVSCLARHGHEPVQYHFAKHETGENDLTMFFTGVGRLSEEERHVWFWYTRYNVTHTDSRAPCGCKS